MKPTEAKIGDNVSLFKTPVPPMPPDNISGTGILLRLRRNAFGAFPERCFTEPVIVLNVVGRKLVLVNSGDMIRHVLSGDTDLYRRVPAVRRVLGPIVGRGLAATEGEAWRQQRRVLAPAFTPRTVPMITGHIMRCADIVCSRLEAAEECEVDLLAEMQGLSLDIAASSMFSLETVGFSTDLRRMVSSYIHTIGRPRTTDFLLPAWLPSLLGWRRGLFRRRWTQLVGSIVARRRMQRWTNAPRDLFDILADAYGGEAEDLLVDEVASIIVGGYENTAMTMFWACFLVAHAPEWQAAVREEALGVDLSPEHAAGALSKLVRTRAVVEETIRLYPPAFMMARQAAQTHQLHGTEVREGALMLMPLCLLQRNPRIWPSPDVFDPRRFLGDSRPDRSAFLPFGSGPQTCIGAQLAMSEAILVLARLLRRSHISPCDERPVLPMTFLSTRPSHVPTFTIRGYMR
jgi:cytochrome P450